jgi:hypothetical protein
MRKTQKTTTGPESTINGLDSALTPNPNPPQPANDPQPGIASALGNEAAADDLKPFSIPAPPPAQKIKENDDNAFTDSIPAVLKEYPANELEDDSPSMADLEVDTGLEIVHARRPTDGKYVALYPQFKEGWILPEDRDSGRPAYRVFTSIGRANVGVCRRVRFYGYVDQYGAYGVWPILLENKKGEIHPYNLSLLEKVEIAIKRGGYHAFRAISGQQAYRLHASIQDYGKPKWPDGGLEQLLDKAFEGHIISSNEDPVLNHARGRVVP